MLHIVALIVTAKAGRGKGDEWKEGGSQGFLRSGKGTVGTWILSSIMSGMGIFLKCWTRVFSST
jgi:hypothetical protein